MVALLGSYLPFVRDGPPPPRLPSPKRLCCVSLLISPEGAAVGFQVDFGRCYMLSFLPSLGGLLCVDNAIQTSCDPAAASRAVGLVDLLLME